LAGCLAPLSASTFNQLGQYANIPANRAYCYAELAISSPVVAITIACTVVCSRSSSSGEDLGLKVSNKQNCRYFTCV